MLILFVMTILFWLSSVPAVAQPFMSDSAGVVQSIDVDIGGMTLTEIAVGVSTPIILSNDRQMGGSRILFNNDVKAAQTLELIAEWHLPYIRDGGSSFTAQSNRDKLLAYNDNGFATVATLLRC